MIKGAGDGEVIFDGDGAQNLFNLMAANYNYFEGITIRNTNVAFLLGIKNIAGASGFTLKHSRLDNIGRGVHDDWSGSKNFYIADNVFIGRHDPDRMMGWNGAIVGRSSRASPSCSTSEYAIKVYGQGHVVAHNYIAQLARRHRHGDVRQSGRHAESRSRTASRCRSTSTSNDIFNMGDNCIETDGGAPQHPRVPQPLLQYGARRRLSAQPMFGGPVYFYPQHRLQRRRAQARSSSCRRRAEY